MSQEAEEKSPTVALIDLGRWFVLFAVGFQLISNILELFLEGVEIRPLVVLTHLMVAVASFVLLWRPWIGLCIGLLPLVFVVITGDAGADPVFFVLASATFAFRYGVRPISTVVLLGTGYGGIRDLVAMRGVDGLVGQMLDYTFLTVFGVFLGLAFKGVLAVLERREVRLAILAGDIVEIRSGERLRLAGELRRVVGERLEEAWKGHKAPRRTSDTWALRDAIERVQTVCLDAVTRVRALVGMLREDPVADGSDESKSIIGSVQILSSAAEALRLQGLHVDLKVDEELDRRSVLTQLTATRVAQLVLKSSDALRPDPLRLKVECPSSHTTRMMVELVTPNKLRSEDKSAFERVRERVHSLGGRFSKGFTGRGHLFEIRLPESRYGEVDDAAAVRGKKKSLGRKILGTAIPLLFLGIMALRTCLTQPLGWALAWPLLGYVSSAAMLRWPLTGGAVAAAAAAGMLITPEQTPVALSIVLLVACWKFGRTQNPYWMLGAGVAASFCMWGIIISGLGSRPELVAGASIPFVGLVYSALSGQYERIRAEQSERAAALMEAIEAARTEERNLLARELHDVLAHHFSVILLQCMAYGESDDPAEVRFALDRIAGSLEAADGELFLLTDVMSEGEEGKLPALVRPLTVAGRLQGTLKNSYIQADFRIDPASDDLPPITRRTLTRAMQEGVTNIIRYADPGGKCLVELDVGETTTLLRICNEMPKKKRESKLSLGYGLSGIQERIDLSGGRFTAGPEGSQWVVTVEIPNRGSEAESVGGPSSHMR